MLTDKTGSYIRYIDTIISKRAYRGCVQYATTAITACGLVWLQKFRSHKFSNGLGIP
ncbi:hypothetical protein M405DRAFT_819817 [Rhizopogon salebrosus TDB-379]|nr:hypothetical protein M405DRAFT_819817 [Rhizopogon salebrosus TDB-379]